MVAYALRGATIPDDWCAAYRKWLRTSTLIESIRNLDRNVSEACRYIDWCRSNGVDVAAPTIAEVSRWIKRARPDGQRSADSTRYVRKTQIAQFYEFLIAEHPELCLYVNPARKVKVRSPHAARPVMPSRLLTGEECVAFLEAAESWTGSGLQARNMVVATLLVHHGCRPAEIRTARLSDYTRPRGGRPGLLRTRIARSTPQVRQLHPQTVEWLDWYLGRVRSGPVRPPGDWLLLSATGGQLYENAVFRLVKAVAERAGLERYWEVSPYAFRRTYINDVPRLGLPVSYASRLAGHRRESTTLRYLSRHSESVDASRLWERRAAELGGL